MNETTQNKIESKTISHCIQPTENNNMNTIHSMNAGIAIGVAQQLNPAVPARAARAAATPAVQRKTLVLGLLAVASCAAIVLCFKAAIVISEVLASIDAAYNAYCT
jgi:hypothetical protein